MTRLTRFLVTLLAFSIVSSFLQAARPADDRPNFIIIFCDDMGYADIGPYGAEGYEIPNLNRMAAEGMVFKVSIMQSPTFRGAAMCFDDPRDIIQAVKEKRLKPGTVVVLRNLGPVASGMPEVLVATSALSIPELDGKVALVSDTRVSGVSHGAIGVHCSPEAAVGGPIGLVRDGDVIEFDLLKGSIHLEVSDTELDQRASTATSKQPQHTRAYLADFAHTVTQAHEGCVSHWVLKQ